MRNLLVCSIALLFSGCAMLEGLPFMRGRRQVVESVVYKENLDTDRLVDLVIVKKLTGKKTLGMFSKYDDYLEGYIRGWVVDYDDNPIEGVVVRAADKGRDLPGFDPGISDANGYYRIRFSLPINKKNQVDLRGAIAYNPPWEQQLEILGATFEPQTKETKFRLFYDRKIGIIGIGEDLPKTITSKVPRTSAPAKAEEKKVKPTDQKTSPKVQPKSENQKPKEDFFQGFGDFGR